MVTNINLAITKPSEANKYSTHCDECVNDCIICDIGSHLHFWLDTETETYPQANPVAE